MMCAGIVAACNASDTERPVVENPALAPADSTPSVDAAGNDAPGATPEEPSSAPPDGPTAATGETTPVAGTTPEQDPVAALSAGEGADAVNGSPDCKQNAFGVVTDAGWDRPLYNAEVSYALVTARAGDRLRSHRREEPASPPFEHTRTVPDVVLIALGTNAF